MNKMTAYAEAQKLSTDGGFVANVILTQHSKPTAKLHGLVKLLKAGHEVRTGQFSIETLIIDGKQYGWEILESPVLVSRWASVAPAEFDRISHGPYAHPTSADPVEHEHVAGLRDNNGRSVEEW